MKNIKMTFDVKPHYCDDLALLYALLNEDDLALFDDIEEKIGYWLDCYMDNDSISIDHDELLVQMERVAQGLIKS